MVSYKRKGRTGFRRTVKSSAVTYPYGPTRLPELKRRGGRSGRVVYKRRRIPVQDGGMRIDATGMEVTSTRTRSRSRSLRGAMQRQYAYKRTAFKRHPVNPRLNVPILIDRLQGVKMEAPNQDADDATYTYPGFFAIGKANNAASPYTVPCYVCNLTCRQGADGQTPLKRLAFDADAHPIWINQTTQDQSGATLALSYLDEDRSGQNTSGYGKYMQFMWYDIRMKLYGARRQSVTYDVMLVSFNNPALCPESVTVQAKQQEDRDNFWQSIVRRQITNTILPGSGFEWWKQMRIVRRKRIVLKAAESSDLDSTPENIDLKWFVKDTRIRKYCETIEDRSYTNVSNFVGSGWPQLGPLAPTSEPTERSRLYLIVTASDMTITTATDDFDDTPSFDMIVRRKSYEYQK